MIENSNDLTTRMHAVAYAFQNPHSTLYRKLYGAYVLPEVPTEADWEAIPLLMKDTLVATPFHERLFSPLSDVHYVRASSGTSGKNLLVVPKTRIHPKLVSDLRGEALGGSLSFLQPQHQAEMDNRAHGIKVPALSGDPANLEACTKLAVAVGVDTLRSYPFIMERHLPYLLETGLAATLKVIILTGERILIEDIHRYFEYFPNARVILYYAAIEAQGVPGFAVVYAHDREILYTPSTDYYWELLDEDGRIIREDNIEGEIVYTTLWTEHNNLPLIRYATGDMGARRRAADGTPRYEILGRKHIDRIKVAKGELRVEEIERALKEVLGSVVPYELHFHKRPEGGSRPKTVIKIEATLDTKPAVLAQRLMAEIRINAADTYGVLALEDLHAPLSVEEVAVFPPANGKRKRFHVHEEG